LVSQDHLAYLPHLVGFRHGIDGLQVQDLGDALAREDMVIAANPLIEAKAYQQATEIIECDIAVRTAAQDQS
jgi:hypothetical protein